MRLRYVQFLFFLLSCSPLLGQQHATFRNPDLDQVYARLQATQYEANLILIDSALRKAGPGADPRLTYFLRRARCEQLYYQGLYDASMVEAEKARRIADRIGDSLLIASSLNQVAVLREEQGADRAAISLLQQALSWYPQHFTSSYPVAHPYKIHGNMGLCWANVGRADSARWHLERSIELARASGSARGEALALFELGRLNEPGRTATRTLTILDSALSIARQNGISDVEIDIIPVKAEALFNARKDAAAVALLQATERLLQARNDIAPRSIISFHERTAHILAEHGRSHEALQAFIRWHALDSTLRANETRTTQEILRTKSATDAALDNELAQRLLTEAQRTAEERSRNIVLYGGGTGLLLLIGTILLFLNRNERRDRIAAMDLARAEDERLLAELRVRQQVSADLHDDLGAGLSALKLQSELAAGTETDPALRTRAQHIATLAGDLVGSMRHILWTLQHNDASIEELVTYTSDRARAFCADHGITLHLHVDQPMPERPADAVLRRNTWAVLRETLRALLNVQQGGVHLSFSWSNGIRMTIHSSSALSADQHARLASQLSSLQSRVAADGGSLRHAMYEDPMITIVLPAEAMHGNRQGSPSSAVLPTLSFLLIGNIAQAQYPLFKHALMDSVMNNTSGSRNTQANVRVIDHAIQAASGIDDPVLTSQLLMARANQFYYRGLFDRGMVDATEALRIAETTQDSLLIATAYNMIGLMHENINDDEAALPWFRTAARWVPADTRSNYPLLKDYHVHGNLAQCFFNMGRMDSATHHFHRSLSTAHLAGNLRASALAQIGLARIARAGSDHDNAFARLDTAEADARAHGSLDVVLTTFAERARGLLQQRRRSAAIATLLSASGSLASDTTISPSSRSRFQRTAAELFSVLGDETSAVRAWSTWHQLDQAIREQDDRATLATLQAVLDNDQRLQEQRTTNERSRLQLKLDRDKRYLLAIIIGSLVVLLVGLVIGIVARRRDQRIIQDLDLRRSIADKELRELHARQRISDDMHEDLGAGLTALKIRTEMALESESDPDRRRQLLRWSALSSELVATLHHIVWALDAGRSSLEESAAYMATYARSYTGQHDIRMELLTEEHWPELQLSMEQRRNLFLVVKEALHNTVKHAAADHVALTLHWENGLHILLADNGKGFANTNHGTGGNGLRNMRKRIEHIGGRLQIDGSNGTAIRIHVPEMLMATNEGSIPLTAA